MSDSDDSVDIPDREECECRCKQFAEVTGTDTALAMFYLQDRKWELERSVNDFFAEQHTDQTSSVKRQSESDSPAKKKQCIEDKPKPDPEPSRIRLLSWNIDGLDKKYTVERTEEVCKVILKENPDIVYLQELVPVAEEIIRQKCPQYELIPGGDIEYYTAIMLKSSSVVKTSVKKTPFPNSVMQRNLVTLSAKVKGVECTLMTSHLESTADFSTERKRQLQQAFKVMAEIPRGQPVIFGGDLNLRDKELQEVGGLPSDTCDLWMVTGHRPEAKFTWDLTRNDNLEWPHKFKPRCRFDRLYLRDARPSRLKPVYFELVGLERLKTCRRFCSDHWGLLAHFDKV